ncbi:MAG: hypothetical protein WC988_01010 [Patescibacteria group bacterium]
MNTLFALTSSSLFYLLPILLGTSFTLLFNKKHLNLYFVFESFAFGSLIIYAIFALNFIKPTTMFIAVSALLSFFVFIVLGITRGTFSKNLLTKNRLLITLFLFILAIISYGLWKLDSPTNATLNWDLYHHQTLANIIGRGNFTVLTTGLSDTFQFAGYTTIFHTLLVTSQRLVQSDILSYWWFVEFFHLAFTVFVSFIVGYSFTKSKTCGLIAALLGAFVFEANGAYTSLFLIPQNLSATLGAVFLSKVFTQHQNDKKIFKVNYLLLLAFIVLNHFIIGAFVVALYLMLAVYLLLNNFNRTRKLQDWFFVFALLVLLAVPLVSSQLDLSWLNRGEAQFFNFTLEQKDAYTKSFYGLSFYILVPLGMLVVLLTRKNNHKALLLFCAVGLSLLFASIPYSTKLYAVSRYFIHTLMALGVWLLIKRSGKVVKAVSLITLILTFAAIYIVNIITYKQVPFYRDISTHVSPSEVRASRFLANNYANKDVLLISDPVTMHILEALSGVNTPGGAYTDEKTRAILSDIYYTRDPRTMALKIMAIKDGLNKETPQKYLLAVGGRFAEWQKASDENKMGIHWNVWEPYDLKPSDWEGYDFIDFIHKYSKFKEVYRNSGIVIFEVQTNAQLFN